MLTLCITAWNYSPGHFADEPEPNTDMVFDKTLEDQNVVTDLQRQFNQLQRIGPGGVVMIDGYRYQFAFLEDGVLRQIYEGATCNKVWLVQEGGARDFIGHPHAILNSLRELIGLPVWTSQPRPRQENMS